MRRLVAALGVGGVLVVIALSLLSDMDESALAGDLRIEGLIQGFSGAELVRVRNDTQSAGGIHLVNVGGRPIVLEEVWVESAHPSITVLDSIVIRPEENRGKGELAGGCPPFPPTGYVTHDPEGFRLAPAERVWVSYHVRVTGTEEARFGSVVVRWRPDEESAEVRTSRAPYNVLFQSDKLARCVNGSYQLIR